MAYLQNCLGGSMAAPGRPGCPAARQACSSYSPFLCLALVAWPHLAFLCIPKHRRGAGVYTLSWAGGIAQKLIAMCEHWLPLEIANVSLSFPLQMLHVKNTNWTLRFGAVASEPAGTSSRGRLVLVVEGGWY